MAERRAWCSCTIIYWLRGDPKAADCDGILARAQAGEFEVLVSLLAYGETVKIDGITDEDAEERIQEFFSRPYVVRAAVDLTVVERSRQLIRKYALSGVDAIHLATALVHGASIFETFDDKLMKKVKNGGGIDGLTVRFAKNDLPSVEDLPLFQPDQEDQSAGS